MPAIWGMIHMDQKEPEVCHGRKMEEAMKPYRLDYCRTEKQKHIILGYGHQDITAQSKFERLPYYDEKEKTFYTADCMIDNRGTLICELGLKEDNIADGALLYAAYRMWGKRFTEHVLGVFSFAVYDDRDNSLQLWVDHTGSRSLYYYVDGQTIYFSTIFAPILATMPKDQIYFNDKWITFCEMSYTPDMMLVPEETPFVNIKIVEAGHYLSFQNSGNSITVTKYNYWRPRRTKYIKRNSNEEYKQLFVNTLQESIGALLRSEEVGITLSSGLDSSTVACVAAGMLAKEQKKLYSFTSVPREGFQYTKDSYFIVDESEGVELICKAYPNIIPEFVRCEGKNAFSELKRLVGLLEFPHKSRMNLVWLDEIYERAANKHCKIMLKGQYGNATISYGRILTRVYDDLLHLRWHNAYLELAKFCRLNKIPKKRAVKILLSEFYKKIKRPWQSFDQTLVQKRLLDQYNVIKEVNRMILSGGGTEMDTRSQKEQFMYDMIALTQLGALDTRFGLMHGVIIRDPLKDKRMIELCYNLPMKCFVNEGTERTLVRDYMRGVIPDAILDITNRRGLQGADFLVRIADAWDGICEDMIAAVENSKLERYFDKEKLLRLIENIRSGNILSSEEDMITTVMICSTSFFLNQYETAGVSCVKD